MDTGSANSSRRENGDSGLDAPHEELLATYLDRLNQGEGVDRERILAEHPESGEALLKDLEAFVGLLAGAASDSNEPLGTLGDYILRRHIGRGGMGIVYDAWQSSMDRRVALKVLPKAIAADTRAVARFIQEAQLAGKLNHPSIVHVHGMGVEEQVPYFAMEYVEGETLAQVLARSKRSEAGSETPFGKRDSTGYFSRFAEAFAEVAGGLQHAHSKGVIHRDIKPSNLILDRGRDRGGSGHLLSGRLRILDFGLARLEGRESLTLSGDVLGTPLYMSPEQAQRRKIPVDHRTDIYSLGATMYEAFCGRPPFRGKDHADTLSQIIERDPVEPRKVNPRVPRDLEMVVLKCLRKDPADRYGTAEALEQDLSRFVRGDPVEARAQSRWERLSRRAWRHRGTLLAAASMALLLTAVGGLLLRNVLSERRRLRETYEPRVLEAIRDLPALGGLAVEEVLAGNAGRPFRFYGLYTGFDLSGLLRQAQAPRLEETAGTLAAIARDVPERPEAHYYRARTLLLLKRNPEALKALDVALARDPSFGPAAALATELRGDGLAAHPAGRDAGPDDAGSWLQAERSLRERRWEEAATALSAILTRSENTDLVAKEAYLRRGAARLASGLCHGAVEDFVRADVPRGSRLEASLLLIHAYHRLGKPAEAERVLEELHGSLDSEGTKESAALLVVATYILLCDYGQAHRWIDRAPGALRTRLRALTFFLENRFDEAAAQARQYRSDHPGDVAAHLLLGEALRWKLLDRWGPEVEEEIQELFHAS